MLTISSVKEYMQYKDITIIYLQESWPSMSPKIYTDCISLYIDAKYILPQWYLLLLDNEVIGCEGLISNDFICRMTLLLDYIHSILTLIKETIITLIHL